MNRERLEDLATMLDEVQTAGAPFDITKWQADPNDCGSAACALGWACRSKKFQAQGLHIELIELSFMPNVRGYPVYRNFFGFGAASEFFDIPFSKARFLFSPVEYRHWPVSHTTAADVSARVRQLLATYDATQTADSKVPSQ